MLERKTVLIFSSAVVCCFFSVTRFAINYFHSPRLSLGSDFDDDDSRQSNNDELYLKVALKCQKELFHSSSTVNRRSSHRLIVVVVVCFVCIKKNISRAYVNCKLNFLFSASPHSLGDLFRPATVQSSPLFLWESWKHGRKVWKLTRLIRSSTVREAARLQLKSNFSHFHIFCNAHKCAVASRGYVVRVVNLRRRHTGVIGNIEMWLWMSRGLASCC